MWDLPRPGLESVSPASAGGFLTTAPPGKNASVAFVKTLLFDFLLLPGDHKLLEGRDSVVCIIIEEAQTLAQTGV